MLNIAVSTTSVDRIAPAGTRTSADMAMDKSAFWIYKGPAFEMLRMLLNGVLLRLFRICIERSMRSLLIPCLMSMVTVSITSILCTMFSSCQDYKNMISLRHGLQNGTQHFTPFLPLFWTQWNERRAESSKQISCRNFLYRIKGCQQLSGKLGMIWNGVISLSQLAFFTFGFHAKYWN